MRIRVLGLCLLLAGLTSVWAAGGRGPAELAAETVPEEASADPPPGDGIAGQASAPIFEAPGPPERRWSNRNIFRRVVADQKFLVTTWWPVEFGRPAFRTPLIGTTAAAVLSGELGGGSGPDQALGRWLKAQTRRRGWSTAKILTQAGNGVPVSLGLGVSWLVGRWTDNERLMTASSLAAESELDAVIWGGLLKNAFARLRPSGRSESDEFFKYSPPGGRQKGSFPSGHAISAFAGATVFSEVYSDKSWAPWVFYGTATAIAASRVGLGRHYPTDVIVGGILGHSIGRMVIARERGDELARGAVDPGNFVPIVDPAGGTFGVLFAYGW